MISKKLAFAVSAGLAGLVASTSANAAFTVSIVSSGSSGGFDYYNIGALNTGGGTGTTLSSVNATITTAGVNGVGSTGNIVFQLKDSDGDGAPDANVFGNAIGTTSVLGSFLRAGAVGSFNALAVSVAPYTTGADADGNQTQNLNAAYTSGTVHSFNVQGFSAAPPTASVTPSVFAHVVVPTGTTGAVTYAIAGDAGTAQSGVMPFGVMATPTPTTTAFTLSATAPTTGTNRGTLAVVKTSSNPVAYAPGTGNPISFTSLTTTVGTNNYTGIQNGYIVANGFAAGDTEAYGFALLDNGGTASAAALNDLSTYINNNSTGVTAVVRGATTLTAAQAAIFRGLPAADQIALISTGTPAASPEYLSFDVSGFTADGNFTITSIAAVPEPVSIAGLTVGAAGLLLARRKRIAA